MKLISTPYILALSVALQLFSAASAEAAKPSAGDYEARPAKVSGVYQLGAFAVVNEGGDRRIVATELYQGIFYPDLGKCDNLNLPLLTESISVSASGRFSVRDVTPVRKESVQVVWKGKWVKPKKVVGTLKIKYKRCSSRIEWVGKRTAAAP